MNKSYAARWTVVETALNKGLNASAEKEVLAILKTATAEQNTEQQLKAMCYYRITLRDRDEQARLHDIHYFEKEIAIAKFPLKPLLQSILGELYWTYYQENRWTIMERTPVVHDENSPVNADIETWTATDFYEKTQACHLNALADETKLKNYNLSQLTLVLDPGLNSATLRPTLYDLICFRALEFFQEEETDITKPAFSFEIKEASAYAPATEFIHTTFQTKDTNSQKFRSLQLFQHLLAFHQNDKDPAAFIDADLLRLLYVNQFSTSPKKKTLYVNALQHVIDAHPNHAGVAMAWYHIAENSIDDQATPYSFYRNSSTATDKSDYNEVLRICQMIVEKFPSSEGAYMAATRQLEILRPTLNVVTEQTVLPQQTSLARVDFKNLQKIYGKIVAVKSSDYRTVYMDYEKLKATAKSGKTIQSWTIELPQTNDHKQHSTEIKVPALPFGNYLLVLSQSEQINDATLATYAAFNVSGLAYISRQQDLDGKVNVYTVDRTTGAPLSNVTVHTWNMTYDYSSRSNVIKAGPVVRSDANGLAVLTKNELQTQPMYIELEKNEDRFFSKQSFYINDYQQQDREYQQTFFFTDRSLYRPGQTIYFKGIMMKTNSKEPNHHELVVNVTSKVMLRNANGEIVKEIDVKTNEFGSFAGTVQAPEGMMNGAFQLIGENGQASIQVEEYKRPKFEVVFDTLKGHNRLNEQITLKGFAKAYAGNQIDGAAVKYRVYRTARFPYYWCFYRWGQPVSAEMEIANGVVSTGVDGSFELQFTAIPDESVDKSTMPIFDYRVDADVTDINGETRSGTTLIPIAYQALQIHLTIPAQLDFNDFHALEISTSNLQGSFQASHVTLTCKRLASTNEMRRARLWPHVDKPIMNEAEFRKAFPLDEYNDENNYQNWPVEQVMWTKEITTQKSGVEYLPKMANRDGWYVVEASAKDVYGEMVTEKKYIRLSTYSNAVALPGDAFLVTDIQLKAEPGETLKIGVASA
nr:MG2 domain-containing protein [Chitinophagaceae bacterium]